MSVSKHHKTSDSKCLNTDALNDRQSAHRRLMITQWPITKFWAVHFKVNVVDRQDKQFGNKKIIWPTGDAAIAERSARRSVSVEMLYE